MLPRRKLSQAVRPVLAAIALTVCQASLLAQDWGGAAKVLVMTGRVSILRDNNEWALNVGSVVQPKQTIFTGDDGYAKFELPDGSTFEVFQNSRVVFRPSQGWGDLLDVWIGRVKAYIQHKNGPNYNRITTQTAVISVRGTVFDVVAEDEETTFVSVDEGLVSVRHLRFGDEVVLQAGQSIRIFRDQKLAQRNIDKGSVGRAALRVAAEAVWDTLARRGVSTGTTTSGGTTSGGAQGDQGKGKNGDSGSGNGAPPPPPPAPPAQ